MRCLHNDEDLKEVSLDVHLRGVPRTFLFAISVVKNIALYTGSLKEWLWE